MVISSETVSINDLLKKNLRIPNYQRPYKWTTKNIDDLLNDIQCAVQNYKKFESNFKYRLGTIILHAETSYIDYYDAETGNDEYFTDCHYNIVDGQQRVISLILLELCLNEKCYLSEIIKFKDNISKANIYKNYQYIKDWLVDDSFITAFKNILEVVVIIVDSVPEAFQLFDSQNSRGKDLEPKDLLKAYHLREMKDTNSEYEIRRAVTKWENRSDKIKSLFDDYLFPILHWSRGEKIYIRDKINNRYRTSFDDSFKKYDIDDFKGLSENLNYTFAKRIKSAGNNYQITEPFIAGKDFFDMIEHYLDLSEDIQKEIANNFKGIANHISGGKRGDEYARKLFYCALMQYYDRFGNFDIKVVNKIFYWAFELRQKLTRLGFISIDKYAVGDSGNNYPNQIAMFKRIALARNHNEIANLQINVSDDLKKVTNE